MDDLPAPTPLTLTVDSDTAEIARARAVADAFLADTGASARARYAVSLCLEELITNIVTHGHGGESGHAVDVHLERHGTGYRLVLEDEASPFDPASAPAPDPGEVGGRGLAMVRRFVRELTHEATARGNRLVVLIDP